MEKHLRNTVAGEMVVIYDGETPIGVGSQEHSARINSMSNGYAYETGEGKIVRQHVAFTAIKEIKRTDAMPEIEIPKEEKRMKFTYDKGSMTVRTVPSNYCICILPSVRSMRATVAIDLGVKARAAGIIYECLHSYEAMWSMSGEQIADLLNKKCVARITEAN